ncbi:uncharacterized protein FIBRA_00328 [Fibroporia radiculosa]|uniref:FYVE-type domain-containing protein n=1 Tax=Fibroporia radiculosa TaxID=599839 RepID=J7S601_9APHY|nr:uncharacterized protein FIBRA_00328 [Fibroporia radiculosa]CCL98334.1 predicted protein [Fibroporia radiculosa]
MNFASVLASRLSSRPSSIHTLDSRDERASIASSQENDASTSSESSSLSLSLSRSCISEPPCSGPSTLRPNEHLAVLLPKRLWKPDAQASHCDIFLCRKRFSVWERRHHCRKCGGIFCGDCSMRATTLLDTSNLDFLYPPRDTPITNFASPVSQVLHTRVCDHCWDQIHGVRTSRSLAVSAVAPIAVLKAALVDSPDSSVTSSPCTPPDGCPPIARPSIRRAHTSSPRIPTSPLRSPVRTLSQTAIGVHLSDSELSSNSSTAGDKDSGDLGELQAYPLRRASIICKATGGGRWEPKQPINLIGHRLPGTKAPYEIELEREEEERRRRKANPILRNGDFQLRVPRELEPRSPAGPIQFSTF